MSNSKPSTSGRRRRRKPAAPIKRVNGNHGDWGRHVAGRPGAISAKANGRGYDSGSHLRSGIRRYGSDLAESAVSSSRERTEIREACRDADRKDTAFQRIVSATVENVIGEGPTFCPSTDSPEWNQAAAAVIARRNRKYHFSPSRDTSENDLSRTVLRSYERDGEVFIYHPRGFTQVFEAGQVHTPGHRTHADLPSGHSIANGRETDALGAVVAYYVGPYDRYGRATCSPTKMLRLPAWHLDPDYDAILPITTQWRHTQFLSADRGISPMAAALAPLQQLDEYIRAILERAIAEACIMATLKSNRSNAAESLSAGRADDDGGSAPELVYDDVAFIEPSIVAHLAPEDEFDLHAPTTPGQMFGTFVKTIIRLASMHRGQPLEIASLDFSDTNFSAARAAIEQAKRLWVMLQKDMSEHWYLPNCHWSIYEAMLDGSLAYHPDWQNVKVKPAGWRYLDPQKDATANKIALQSETTITRKGAGASRDFFRAKAREIAEAREIAAEENLSPEDSERLIPYAPAESPPPAPAPPPHDED